MPMSFGQQPLIQQPGFYEETLALVISYEIDYDVAQRLMPTWIGADGKRYGIRPRRVRNGKPVLSFTSARIRGVNALSWRNYNALVVNLSAEFIGEHPWISNGEAYDGARGHFQALVLENDAWACMLGREALGVPKLYTDIPDPWLIGGNAKLARFAVKDRTRRRFVTGKAALATVPPRLLALMSAGTEAPASAAEPDGDWGVAQRFNPHLGGIIWKYFPHPNFSDADLSYAGMYYGGPTLVPGDPGTELASFDPLMVGVGRIRLKSLLPRQFPECFQAVNKLKQLMEQHCTPFAPNAMLLRYPHYVLAGHRMDGPVMPTTAKVTMPV